MPNPEAPSPRSSSGRLTKATTIDQPLPNRVAAVLKASRRRVGAGGIAAARAAVVIADTLRVPRALRPMRDASVARPAGRWDAVFAGQAWGRWPHLDAVRAIARHRTAEEMQVLEVGCGAGAQLRYLEEEGHNPTGIDFSLTAIRQARSGGLGGVRRLAGADATALPFRAETFDLALDVEVLAYVPDLHSALQEMSRVLRPGGIVVSIHFTPATDPRLDEYLRNPIRREEGELRAAHASAGLKVVDEHWSARSQGPKRLQIHEAVIVSRRAHPA